MTDPELKPTRLRNAAGPGAELLASALADAPRASVRDRALAQVLSARREERRRQRWIATGVAGAMVLAATILLLVRSRVPGATLVAEKPAPATSRPVTPTAPSASSTATDPLAPCTPAAVADGASPLIDDFEDGDGRILLSEKRASSWSVFNDGTGTQHPLPGTNLRAARIRGGRGDSRFGLHSRGSQFTDWGASVAAELSPKRCYDASVYAGLQFWARGRGQLRVAAKMTQVVSEEYGGSCVETCFDAHLTTLTLTPGWQRHTVSWSELAQSGFGAQLPFDPRSLYSIEFSVLPSQTPFDFWIDDLAFLPRDQAR